MTKKLNVKNVISILATIFMVICLFAKPFPGLEPVGMRFLGIFVWWIFMMLLNPIPNYLSSMIGVVIAIVAGCTTLEAGFSAFSGSTIWILIGCLGLAAGLTASGVLTRIALHVLKLFPGTFTGQFMAVTTASIVLAPMFTAPNAKTAILLPVVNEIGDQMGYEPHSKGVAGMASIVAIIANFHGIVFMTGSVNPAFALSLCGGTSMSWIQWFLFALVWTVVSLAILLVIHLIYFNPDRGKPKAERSHIGKEVIQARIDQLPRINWREIVSLVVLLVAAVLWITESIHGIPSAVIAIAVWCVYMLMHLFSAADFSTKIPWSLVVFIGCLLGLSNAVGSTGVSAWVAGLISPVVAGISGNPALVIIFVALICFALKFGTVNYFVTAPIFIAMLSDIAVAPIVIAFVCVVANFAYFFSYQSFTMVGILATTEGRVEYKDLGTSTWWYFPACILGILASIPWWSALGYIG